jgi:hypothetical protein
MAEQQRKAQLAHERLGELIKGVRKYRDGQTRTNPGEEGASPRERFQVGHDGPQATETKAVASAQFDTKSHEAGVVLLVAGGPSELGHTGMSGYGVPDFRDEDALQVQGQEWRSL